MTLTGSLTSGASGHAWDLSGRAGEPSRPAQAPPADRTCPVCQRDLHLIPRHWAASKMHFRRYRPAQVSTFRWRETLPLHPSIRERILEYAFEHHLPPVADVLYFHEWGEPRYRGS